MRPKVVSVKQLQIRQLPPPSEKEVVFLEMHGRLGSQQVSETKPVEQKIATIPSGGRKGFFGWLKAFFGR